MKDVSSKESELASQLVVVSKAFEENSEQQDSATPYQLLQKVYRIKNLKEVNKKYASSSLRGTDRLSGIQFQAQLKPQLKTINTKCRKGNYNFAPYLEKLSVKGRGKSPRIVGIPTVRDRIALSVLKDLLSSIFSDCVPKNLANTYIYRIKSYLENNSSRKLSYFKTDITSFYDSIDRDLLKNKLKKRIKSKKIINLVDAAISNPIVPKNYSRKSLLRYATSTGVPQGLSISNILASIYLREMDLSFQEDEFFYCRYVDDILVLAPEDKICSIKENIIETIELEKLSLSQEKTELGKISRVDDKFEYLGYKFRLRLEGNNNEVKVVTSVRDSSKKRFIESIAAMFSRYCHSKNKRLRSLKKKKSKIKEADLIEFFILELNERITGAVSEKKRYGWIFYFNAISDLEMLYQLDKAIESMFLRRKEFHNSIPANLKSLVRAFHESKHSPLGGYIHNYNNYKTSSQKLLFLENRGKTHLIRGRSPDEKEIDRVFELIRGQYLSQLEADQSQVY